MQSLMRFLQRRKASDVTAEERTLSSSSSSSSPSASSRSSTTCTSGSSFASGSSSAGASSPLSGSLWLSQSSLDSVSRLRDRTSSVSSTGSSSKESNHSSGAPFECTMTIQSTNNTHQFPVILIGDDVLYSTNEAEVKVIHCSTGSSSSIRARFARSEAPVKTLAVHGDTVFTAHHDLKIRVWKTKQQHSQHKLVATLPSIRDCLATYILPNSHVKTRRHRQQLRIQHYDAISALATSTCGGLLYTGSWDRTVKVWRLSDFKCIDSFEAHSDAVNALVASRDGHLYSGSADGKVKVWERGLEKSSKYLLTAAFQEHSSGVNALVLSSDELFLFSASGDKMIIVWEREGTADHMSVYQVLKGHQQAVLCLVSSKSVLCSGSADKTVRVWKRVGYGTTRHSCLAVLQGHKAPVKSLSLSTTFGSCRVFTSSLDGTLKVWQVSLAEEQDQEEINQSYL